MIEPTASFQNLFTKQFSSIQSSLAYKNLQEMPKIKRWGVISGLLIAS